VIASRVDESRPASAWKNVDAVFRPRQGREPRSRTASRVGTEERRRGHPAAS